MSAANPMAGENLSHFVAASSAEQKPNLCPRCGLKDPIFGDSCAICHSIPTHAAMLLKAFRERIVDIETKNEQIQHIYGTQLNAAEARADRNAQESSNLMNRVDQALQMLSAAQEERDALKIRVAELERELGKSTPQGQ